MITRWRNRLKFKLERLLLHSALTRLLVIAVVIALVSLVGGLLAYWATGHLDEPDKSIWWAFLRLSDPGYLGDDEGTVLRMISTVLTVLGYVLFMGALIAIMTQWLNATIERLQMGLTPITEDDHLLILGWNNRTPTIVQQLLASEGRVRRFLRRHGKRQLRIVILTDKVSPPLVQDLKDRLGPLWDPGQIAFRSGSPLRLEHLHRVDYLNTSAILLPASDFTAEGETAADARTIKALLSTGRARAENEPGWDGELPLMVAELFDSDNLSVAQRAYGGPIELLASDEIISRLIAQQVHHPGLSYISDELLSNDLGNKFFIRECPQFSGELMHRVADAFPQAVLLGVTRSIGQTFEPILCPPADFRFEAGDSLVFIARDYDHTEPVKDFRPADTLPPQSPAAEEAQLVEAKRILVLGWNHRAPTLLREFDHYGLSQTQIDVVSLVPAEQRNQIIADRDLQLPHLQLRQIEADWTARRAMMKLEPGSYDNVVLLASDWMASAEQSDARTIMGYLVLNDALDVASGRRRPCVLVELADAGNADLVDRERDDVFISPLLMSHMLSQVALRSELRSVFEELFAAGGAEIFFQRARRYAMAGKQIAFREIQAAVAAVGEIAIGLRFAGNTDLPGGILLNPDDDQEFALAETDELVVITRY